MPTDDCPLLDDWRQGDLSFTPVEIPAILDGEEGLEWHAVDAAHGVMIVSQSCDIIRSVDHRPFVQIAALVRATDDEIARAIRRETPSRIHLNCLVDMGLLVDLDVTATVHKTAVARWERTPGCQTDDERRKLGAALARYRQRFAFPDDFNAMIQPVRRWIEAKRSKQSAAGSFVRALHEVRVRCDDWTRPSELTFYAIIEDFPEPNELAEWNSAARALEQKAEQAKGDYPCPEFQILRYCDLSAAEYLQSERLDWEGLSDAA